MLKQAQFLLEKHKRDVWVDGSGDIWFYDGPRNRWRLLVVGVGPPCLVSDQAVFVPESQYGPFTRLWKSPR